MNTINPAAETAALDRLLDPIRDSLTPEVAARLVGLRADDATQARLESLAERHQEGIITPSELVEYDGIVRAAALLSVLQAKARSRMSSETP